ncbi:MAG: penicillin-binding protein activator [Pseudomonadota bacterium]
MPRSLTSTQPPHPQRTRQVALLLPLCGLLLAVLAACSSLGGGAAPASVDRAERLVRQGNHVAAAEMYAQLAAANPPPEGVTFAFAAAREWLAARRPEDAQRVLAALGTPALPAQAFELSLLSIEVQVARGQGAEAWRRVSTMPEPRAPRDAAALLTLRQRVALATNRPVEAVQAAVAQERIAATDTERNTLRRELLSQLRQAVDRGMKIDPQASREPLVRGWLELGMISANAGRSPLNAVGEIERWRGRYPGHPGSTIAPAEILGQAGTVTLGAAGTQVALLLPLTGGQAAAATLVRDGFVAAMNQLPEGQRPLVKVYDTGAMSVSSAMATAQGEGAGFFVGPLTRAEITEAINQNVQRTPMLLLNFLPFDQPAPPFVYQFALSPEDEARQIARRALAQGQRRAIVLAPTGEWGTRVVAAFREELTRGGGAVISQQSYDPTRSEFTAPIRAALLVDGSIARHRRIQEIVGGNLEFQMRRRGDVQFIFAASQQALALRQIRPQLRYFYAGDVPTYMTSDSFDPDASANRDIDGMLFPDMPWMLQDSGPVAEIRSATQTAWADRGTRLPRLFAFGYDAGQLMLNLGGAQTAGQQRNWPIAGLTGRLAPNDQRRINRDLDWAQIRDGQPQVVAPPANAPL